MDESGRLENGRHKMDYYRGVQSQWNMMQHQVKETNALAMNQKIMLILSEKDAAIRERDLAISETKEALETRDEAFQQRDQALAERDSAMMERDNALAALQYGGNSINFPLGGGNQRGAKRMHHPSNHLVNAAEPPYITDAFPLSAISSECVKPKRSKENNAISSNTSRSPGKGKKVSEDLNRQVPSDGKKIKSEWDSQDVGLNLITFDESSMPVPVCSCTGVPRQCYKWGNGGWQSSCCTTTLSSYPLPQMPNKRHARVGGRKMSGSVFSRLLSRVAAEGRDMSVALDLKDYWAKHGTNRYITIK